MHRFSSCTSHSTHTTPLVGHKNSANLRRGFERGFSELARFPEFSTMQMSGWNFSEFLTVLCFSVVSSLLVMIVGHIISRKWAPSASDRDLPKAHHRSTRGPKFYPLVGCQIELIRNMDFIYDWVTTYLRNDATHTIRVKRPLSSKYAVVTANPENVEYILKTNFLNYPKGETVIDGLRPLLGDGIFNVDGDEWRSQRRVASFEFSTKSLKDFVVKITHHETYDRLLPLLAKANTEGNVVDIQDLLMRFGFDSICLLGFGVDIGCLGPSLPEIEFANAFDEATRLIFQRMLIPRFLYPVTAFLAYFRIGNDSRLNKLVKVVDRFAMSVIQKRRQELKARAGILEQEIASKFSRGHDDLLSRFIRYDQEVHDECNTNDQVASSQKYAAALSDKYLRDIILNFVIAGRDTSSVALTWLFWLLPQHPEVEEKIMTEITNILQARNESFQLDGSTKTVKGFSYDELREMHYVQAAVTEAMRLYPPVPTDSKTALRDDHLPDGTFVQKGDRMAFHPYAMGRMEDLWGKDCLEFRPERFLQDGKFVPENSFKYPVFQAGPRICLGKEMAYTQMKYIIAAIYSSPHRFRLLPNQRPKGDLSLTLKMKDGLKGTVESVETGTVL